MKLTASPFDPATGTLLPVYRDAYLRGDLARHNTTAVDRYLQTNKGQSDDTLRRFYDLKKQGDAVRPVGWMQRQLELIRTEPQRFRQRAAGLVLGALLVAGASMAASNLPDASLPAGNLPTATFAGALALPAGLVLDEAPAAEMRTVTVRGRILNENGRPLVGATVLDKATGRGVGTDAEGNYALRLPASQAAASRLQFAYGGYAEEEMTPGVAANQSVTLLPRKQLEAGPRPRRHWRFW